MRITKENGRLRVSGVPFDAKQVLIDSAQVFHWIERADGYAASVAGRAVLLTPSPVDDGFTLTGLGAGDADFWRVYFDLDRDYRALAAECAGYPVAVRALELLPGMRVLRQPAWEALIAFILSANNNVARIRRLVLALCEALGERAGAFELHSFPSPQALANAEEALLRQLGVGYRAPYLIATARAVAEGFPLDCLHTLPHEEAHKHLLTLKGVGPKVADCVLLFGCGHTRAFPVDVWVARLMRQWFDMRGVPDRAMAARALQMFGKNAGLIQQSLFHCARLGLIEL